MFNILLQVLDDGRLTDGQGRTVDFRNSVIIMTSNLGSDRIQEHFGELDYEGIKTTVMEVVGHHFRPEFINRVDETVVFHPLGEEHIKNIASIQITRLIKRLEEKDYQLVLQDSALEMIAQAGFDPVYGARPLKRAIQHYIENPLAQDILSGKFVTGKEISIVAENERIIAKQ